MRSFVALAACFGLAAAVAGCSSVDGDYIRNGIGTNLGTPELVEVTRLQDIYVGEICRQAGLRVSQQGDFLVCDEVGMSPGDWATFVQAGMNDIDRRCDAYLAWLDNKRRWREPILAQLHSTAAATAAILGLTKVGAAPIAIVATAFGFAQESFINFESRLLLMVNQSTVQSLVLTRQLKFRGNIIKDPVTQRPVVIANRPAAAYVLRSYLRICMPFSIETEINTTLTGVDAGAPNPVISSGASQSLFTAPASERTVQRPAIIRDVNAPLSRPDVRPPIVGDTRIGPFEQRGITAKDLKAIVEILGCSGSDLGPAGSPARRTLAKFLTDNSQPTSDRVTDDVAITLRELKAQGKKGTCSG